MSKKDTNNKNDILKDDDIFLDEKKMMEFLKMEEKLKKQQSLNTNNKDKNESKPPNNPKITTSNQQPILQSNSKMSLPFKEDLKTQNSLPIAISELKQSVINPKAELSNYQKMFSRNLLTNN